MSTSAPPATPSDPAGEPVSLYIYDLSNGLAAMWGQALTGRPVEGIWHTSLVLYGMEVFFGQGISIVSPPGTTHHGVPKKKLPCGVTHLDKETFLEYIEGLRETYTAEAYHLLEFNCNTFTNDVLSFLNGSSIPSYILSQPSEIMSTPFGAQMRPMIEQMFVGRRTATAGRADIGRLASQLGGGGGLPTPAPTPTSTPPSAESVSSNLQIVTSAASLRSTLASAPSVIVLYTHAHASAPSPSPSASSKQTFESLAPKYARTKFVLVETHLARGGPGEFADLGLVHGGDEGGSEMLALFAQSRCVRSIPSPGERIEDQVKWLEDRLWPEHPHAALGLSQIDALQREVMPTWRSVPKKEGLEKKLLDEVVGEGDEREVMRGLVERVFEAAAARGGEVVEVREREWIAAIEFVEALSGAPKLDAPLFPLIDLLRLAFSLPATSSNVSPTTLTYLPRLLTTLSTTLHTRSTSHPSLETDLVTSLKLVSNLVSPAIQPRALTARIPAPDCVPSVTRLVLHALLLEGESEKLRLVAAQTALALVVRVGEECRWSDEEGAAGEEWEVEVASAVVEALASAVERGAGVEILHPLTATLGAVLFRSPHFSSTLSLLEVLDADVVLARVEERVKGEKRTSELVGEVRRLIKSGAAGEDEA